MFLLQRKKSHEDCSALRDRILDHYIYSVVFKMENQSNLTFLMEFHTTEDKFSQPDGQYYTSKFFFSFYHN